MKILVFDNYDSFTYNLVHYIKELGFGDDMEVHRNDKIALEEVNTFDKILLSPGPGIPEESGIMPELIATYAPTKSILGICLGHQGIGEAFGAALLNMPEVLHGIPTDIIISEPDDYLFKDVPAQFTGGRYHSWLVKRETVHEPLHIIAKDAMNNVMGLAHKTYDVKGLQFHPESILTTHGKTIMLNWLKN